MLHMCYFMIVTCVIFVFISHSIFFSLSLSPILFCIMYLGDIIIKEGTIGSKMYFIQEGIVDIVMANGEVRKFFYCYFYDRA